MTYLSLYAESYNGCWRWRKQWRRRYTQ